MFDHHRVILIFTYGNDWFNFSTFKSNYSSIKKDSFKSFKLQLNGQDRTAFIKASVLRVMNNYYHHSLIPDNYIYYSSLCPKTRRTSTNWYS